KYLSKKQRWNLSSIENIDNLLETIKYPINNCIAYDNLYTYILYNGKTIVRKGINFSIGTLGGLSRIYGNKERQGIIGIDSRGKLYYNGSYITTLLKQSNCGVSYSTMNANNLRYKTISFDKSIKDILYLTNVIFLLDNFGDI